ncbi:hypothetical protein GGR57DRAFT_226524 [Xylariaceae sp. FL1272]|nr:hypothetical protein GGR57DRAFT_226524 [Xylariaceae sp. FL1272]
MSIQALYHRLMKAVRNCPSDDPPPPYQQEAVELPPGDRHNRPRSLDHKAEDIVSYIRPFFKDRSTLMDDYLSHYIWGETTGEDEVYLDAALNEYEQMMVYVDFLVDLAGLTRPDRDNCPCWNGLIFVPRGQPAPCFAELEITLKAVSAVISYPCLGTPLSLVTIACLQTS